MSDYSERDPDAFSVREAIDSLASTQPDTIAMTTNHQSVSFAELAAMVEEKAIEIAAISGKLGKQNILPVLVDYSLESVVNILACLWVRQPFSPIDEATPAGRLEVLRELLGNPSTICHPKGISGDAVDVGSNRLDTEPPAPLPYHPGETGAVFMTSGSTGTPKGVMIPWSTLDYRLRNYFFSLEPHTLPMRATSLAPLNFVAGFLQISLLLHGVGLFRVNPKDFSPKEMLSTISRYSPTHLFLPSQLFRVLSRVVETSGAVFPDCLMMTVGGESVRCEDLHRFADRLPAGTQFRHVLGATESMRFLDFTAPVSQLPPDGLVPVGSEPIPDTTQLIPQGENLFEVWCSGPIASGYLSDSPTHHERFVTDESGTLWWKSGDLVSWTEQRTLIHRGRMDDTIKVRGKLASPSEIVFQLEKLPEVRGAYVTVESHRGEDYFVAHVDCAEKAPVTVSQLRQALSKVLDSHLVPRRFVMWEGFPLNAHGKVDRHQLSRALDADAPEAMTTDVRN